MATSYRTLLHFELRHRSWWAALVLLLGLNLSITLPELLRHRIALWTDTLGAMLLALYLVGPLLAGATAWFAMRERQHRLSDLLHTTALPTWRRRLLGWMGSVLLGISVLSLLFLILGGWTMVRGAWGVPNGFLLLDTLLGVTFFVTVGAVVGRFIPRLGTPLLLVVALYILTELVISVGYRTDHLASRAYLPQLLPTAPYLVWNYHSTFYGGPPARLVGVHMLWLAAWVAACLWLLAERGQRWRRRGMFVSVLVAALCAPFLLSVPIAAHPPSYKPYDSQCIESIIEVCGHPAYAALLPEATALIGQVSRPFVGLPGGPVRAEQQDGALPDGGILPNGFLLRGNGTLWFALDNLNMNPEVEGNIVAWNLAGALVQDQTGQGAQPHTEAQAVVATWLLAQAGRTPVQPYFRKIEPDGSVTPGLPPAAEAALTRLEQLPDEERRAWFSSHLQALRSGDLSLSELP